jgi:hypothetical protein
MDVSCRSRSVALVRSEYEQVGCDQLTLVSTSASVRADGADSKMSYYTLLVAWQISVPSRL